jgi:DNA-binding CsgD family transcriptional regulator
MDIQLLSAKSGPRSVDQRLCKLIGAIGTPAFERAMLALAGPTLRCAHLTAFSVSKRHQPRVLIAINDGGVPTAPRIAAKYLQDYWALDPANKVIEAEPRLGSGATIRLDSDEIKHPAYLRDCYRAVRLVDRLSIVKSQGAEIIRINFYRDSSRGRFADSDLDVISGLADVLTEIVRKHDHVRPALSKEERQAQYCARLSAYAPRLSSREVQVCVEIVSGFSSEAIAGRLGLSVNTILTHRRRAYAKLSISSQNELSHILLQ